MARRTKRRAIPELARVIQERLWEVQQWCGNRPVHINSPADGSLYYQDMGWRSPELKPTRGFDALGRQTMVEELCIKRRALKNRYPYPQVPKSDLLGRIMVYVPDVNRGCPLAQREVNGFFDHNNMPPWDTWLAFVRIQRFSYSLHTHHSEPGVLLSWVPEHLSEDVSWAMHANFDECIYWLGEMREDDDITDQLEQMTTQKIDLRDGSFNHLPVCHVRPR